MGEEWNSVPHPKTVMDNMKEEAHLDQLADKALHAGTDQARTDGITAIRTELEQMTPIERMGLARDMKMISSALDRDSKDDDKSLPVSAVPKPTIELDEKGDLKSVSFENISTGKGQGDKINVNLDHRRTDEGANTSEVKLADGTLRVVEMSKDGKQPVSIQDSNGLYMKRDEGKNTWTRYENEGGQSKIQDVKVNSDNSLTYKSSDLGKDATITESVLANGDVSRQVKATVDGQEKTMTVLQHQENPDDGTTNRITTMTATVDGKVRDFNKVTELTNGSTIEQSLVGRVEKDGSGDQMTVQNVDANGNVLPGKVDYQVTRDAKGDFASGSMVTTFPDGTVKTYNDMTSKEWQQCSEGMNQHIVWTTKDGDPHHFSVAVLPKK